ncbi:MAG: hypothetical protein DRG11_05820 [Epsilonproteobacteria bacterium]|nr:MAG: hypothetical protein DRG11_05820 [Campylobacterota bacterium]
MINKIVLIGLFFVLSLSANGDIAKCIKTYDECAYDCSQGDFCMSEAQDCVDECKDKRDECIKNTIKKN